MLAVELESFLILNLCEYALVDENDTSSHKTGTAITCTKTISNSKRNHALEGKFLYCIYKLPQRKIPFPF